VRQTGQQQQQHRDLRRDDLLKWLLCCAGMSTLALAASWQLLQPLLISSLADSLTRRARWFNYALGACRTLNADQMATSRLMLPSMDPSLEPWL